MAKAAKQQEVEITPRLVDKFLSDMADREADLESARGSFAKRARTIREGKQALIDSMAARGVPPKLTKLLHGIERTQTKLRSQLAELDAVERKLMKKLATAHGDKAQLSLFADLPAADGPEAVVIETKSKGKKRRGVAGDEIPAPADTEEVVLN